MEFVPEKDSIQRKLTLVIFLPVFWG